MSSQSVQYVTYQGKQVEVVDYKEEIISEDGDMNAWYKVKLPNGKISDWIPVDEVIE